MQTALEALIWFCAVGNGVMAGVYFTFSAFAMRALASIETPAAIAAMQAVNVVIQRSAFLPLFFATSLASALAVVAALYGVPEAGAAAGIAGAVYVVGMFGCTVGFNVPLNERLDAVDPSSEAGAELWAHYLRVWTRWNHVRTVACTLSTIGFIIALGAG